MEKIKDRVHDDFEKLRNNPTEHFSEFYENNYKLVYRIAYSILKDEDNSEDVAQNVLTKIYGLSSDKLPTSYESSWLYTVTKNEALQFIRKNSINSSLDEKENYIESQSNEIGVSESNYDYENVVKKLNKKEEQIINLKVESEFTFKEIGEIMCMPTATVQWYYYKSLKSLRLLVGNLAMFVIAFTLGVALKQSNKTTNNYYSSKEEQKSDVPNNEEAQDSTEANTPRDVKENSKATNRGVVDSVGDIKQTTSSDASYPQGATNWSSVSFVFAGLFLALTIICTIYFIKHQKKKK